MRGDVCRPTHACQRQRREQSENETKKALSSKHLVNFAPRNLNTSMHARCQRVVTLTYRGTSLIVRDLSSSGNAKFLIGKNRISDVTYSETATYAEITRGQTPSVTCYQVTGKVLGRVQRFAYGKFQGFKVSRFRRSTHLQ